MKVKTALVIDRLGSALMPGEEAQEIVDGLTEYGLDIEVVKTAETMLEVFRDSFDLLVIDYGGLGIRDEVHAKSQIRAACQWAEDHPGSILLLWTPFTKGLYEGEFEREFGHIDNIWYHYDTGYDFSEHDRRDAELTKALRLWFA